MRAFFIGFVLLFLPAIASAAGFAGQPLFLSKSTVSSGDTVLIYAVLLNDTSQAFSGQLRVYDEYGPIGSTSVILAPGIAETVSVPWQPTGGNHFVQAVLENNDGLTTLESENATFTIGGQSNGSVPLEPEATIESSQPIAASIQSVIPAVAPYITPFFSTIDAGRTDTLGFINQGMVWSRAEENQSSIATPAGTTQAVGLLQMVSTASATFLLAILTVLEYVLVHLATFYGVIIIFLFILIWMAWRALRPRPIIVK